MDKKEALFMETAVILRKDEMAMAQAMKKYVCEMQKDALKNPESAKKEAKKALIRTGVATPRGNLKKIIVSWE